VDVRHLVLPLMSKMKMISEPACVNPERLPVLQFPLPYRSQRSFSLTSAFELNLVPARTQEIRHHHPPKTGRGTH
jgi:hypothetical protein